MRRVANAFASRVGIAAMTVAVSLVFLGGGRAAAEIYHVYEGQSIQAVIDRCEDGDEIVVHPGTYYETINFLGKAIWLRSSDGPEVTIIDGQGVNRVVLCVAGEGSDTVIEGLTITNGTAFDNGANQYGGGMLIVNSSPSLVECRVTGNSGANGGGIAVAGDSALRISRSVISGNFAWDGSGLYSEGSTLTIGLCDFSGNGANFSAGGMLCVDSTVTITQSTFRGNSAWTAGGGILCIAGDLSIEDCEFTGNLGWGGGLNCAESTVTISRCLFQGNSGGLGSGGAIGNSYSTLEITDTSFIENDCGRDGGGLLNSSSDTTLIRTSFVGNWGGMAGGRGGGVCNEAGRITAIASVFKENMPNGILNYNATGLLVVNCLFTGHWGSPILNMGSDGVVANSTFARNMTGHEFEAIRNDDSSPYITGCLLWDNEGPQIGNYGFSQPTVTFCNIQGGYPGGIGNIDMAPLFVDPVNGDFRLLEGSPCIDAGDNSAFPPDIDTDLDGNPRFLNDTGVPDTGSGGADPVVDIGAYEFGGATDQFIVVRPVPGIAGQANIIQVAGGTPRRRIYFVYGVREGQTPVPGCPALSVEITNPLQAGWSTSDSAGNASLAVEVPSAASGARVLFQAVAPASCSITNVVSYRFL